MISSRQIANAIIKIKDDGKYSNDEIAKKLFVFVKKYSLEPRFEKILYYIKEAVEKENNEKTLLIQSPKELDSTAQNQISKFVGVTKGSFVKTEIKSSLIGGFRAYYKDKKFDGSIQNTLEKLKISLLTQ